MAVRFRTSQFKAYLETVPEDCLKDNVFISSFGLNIKTIFANTSTAKEILEHLTPLLRISIGNNYNANWVEYTLPKIRNTVGKRVHLWKAMENEQMSATLAKLEFFYDAFYDASKEINLFNEREFLEPPRLEYCTRFDLRKRVYNLELQAIWIMDGLLVVFKSLSAFFPNLNDRHVSFRNSASAVEFNALHKVLFSEPKHIKTRMEKNNTISQYLDDYVCGASAEFAYSVDEFERFCQLNAGQF